MIASSARTLTNGQPELRPLTSWTVEGLAWLEDLRRYVSQAAMELSVVTGAVVGLVIVAFIRGDGLPLPTSGIEAGWPSSFPG